MALTRTKTVPTFRRPAETSTAGAKTLPQRYFVSPEIFLEEQRAIFSSQWVLVGHQSQVARTGDYFLAQVAGESLIIVRDQKNAVRAFYNVCRHRGTRLIEDSAGHAAAIQCPYHAWTYSLDGRLTGAPDMQQTEDFDKGDYPLHRVHLELWEGFIFVSLSKTPVPFEEALGPLHGKFSQFNLPNLRSVRRIEYDVQANWKLIFENYSECYHCPGVHPTLTKLSPSDSAENDLFEGPFLGGYMLITKGRSLSMSGNLCAMPVSGTPGEQDDARIFYYSIFPNMLLSLHSDYVMVHQIWPQSPERTLILCDWFFHPDAPAGPNFRPDDAIEFWDMTNKQDWHVCELSQQGIASRAYQPGPYSGRESIPAAWDREYLRHVG